MAFLRYDPDETEHFPPPSVELIQMCPPANSPPPIEVGEFWSDNQIILILEEFSRGSRLPDNVLKDSSPYRSPPSSLPEGIWYLIGVNEKKESVLGYWRAKGEACKIYSDSEISGCRTTLEYFEGTSPHGQKTDWLMQEYKIIQKEIHDKNSAKESVSLCRVFSCTGSGSKSEPKQVYSVASNIPIANTASGQNSRTESKEEEHELGLLQDAGIHPNTFLEVLSEQECFLRGDYIELNDLEDPESHSSSSRNSSCQSNLSDEYFDSLAFIRDLEEELGKQPSSLVEANNVVMNPAPSSGSVLNGSNSSASIVERSIIGSTVQEPLTAGSVVELSNKRPKPESSGNEGPSNFSNMPEPLATPGNVKPKEEKKAGSSIVKKLKIYFCLAF